MDFWNSARGMIRIELTAADPAASLYGINLDGIAVHHIKWLDDLTVQFLIRRRDYRLVSDYVNRRGERIRILRLEGKFWDWKRVLKRPVLILGLGILLLTALYLPSRVLFVSVEGNSRIPDKQILEQAALCGIRFGANRREVRSEKMKNALLGAIDQLQWAGINTRGCTAVITVRERIEEDRKQDEEMVSSIVAARDGIICNITVAAGSAKCQVGDAVRKGQVLISGYTDCGLCIRAEQAKGDISAVTRRELYVITPAVHNLRSEILNRNQKWGIIIGKKRINFFKDSGISDSRCVKMYEEYPVILPGGFQLPVRFFCMEIQTFEITSEEVPEDTAEQLLQKFAPAYLKEHMVAGSITGCIQPCLRHGDVFILEGKYNCTEMIGRQQFEETILHYDETS